MVPKEMRLKAQNLTQDGILNLKMSRILAIMVAIFMIVIVMMPAGSSAHTPSKNFQNQMSPAVVHNYNVTFIEKGLPRGMQWEVGVLNESSHVSILNTTTTERNVVSLPNGSYAVQAIDMVSPVDYIPYMGNTSLMFFNKLLSVDGKALTLNITFVRAYQVNFTESGLPGGNSNSWSISWKNITQGYNASAQTLCENLIGHTGINLTLANGTYQYYVKANVDGYFAKPSSGNFTVSGQNMVIPTIVFSNHKYNVTFYENGIPNGTPWSVTFNGHSSSSKTSTITFSAAPGTYSYTIGLASIYQAQPDNGTITVSSNTSVPITFSKLPSSPGNEKIFASLFPVGSYADYVQIGTGEDNVTYLGNGTTESMPLMSTLYFNYSVNAISNYVINLSYTETIISSNGTKTTSTSYMVTPTADIYSWAGYTPFANQKTPALLFVNTSDPASSYLPNSVYHSVRTTTISLLGNSYSAFNILGKMKTSSNGTWNISYNVNYAQSNGMALMGDLYFNGNETTTQYKVAGNAELNVSLLSTNVASLNASVNTTTYQVTFTEAGLPAGTSWYVNLSNGIDSGAITGASYSFLLANGTYSYSIGSVSGYTASPASGSITFNGKNVSQSITFTPVKVASKYTVTFTEAGLPAGTSWYVNLSNGIDSGAINGTSYTFLLANGTYTYTVGLVSAYQASPNNGTIIVAGASQNVSITFAPITHEIYGYVKGTVSPGNATVTVDGRIIQVIDGSFNISLLPGTYYLSFTANGYNGSVREINLQAGKTVTVNVVLTQISNAVTLSGYITPDNVNASLLINGIIVYVNSTGYYSQSVTSGTYTISAYANGYYPYSQNVTVSTSRPVKPVNITLVKEPSPTSGTHTGNANATGYNVTVTNLIIGKGNITLSFNSTGNGTLVVQIPFKDVGNATISEILNSTVYINGTQYKNFTITISSNYTVILKVYNLPSKDPTLYWGYSPYSTAPKTTPPKTTTTSQTSPPNIELYEIIAAVALIGIIAGTAGVLIRKKR